MANRKKPSALKLLQGTYNTTRQPDDEPVFERAEDLDPPAHLDVLAEAKWRELAPLLREQGVLTVADLHNLEVFCEAYQRWRDLVKQIKVEGFVITGSSGTRKHPAATAMKEAEDTIRFFGGQLGLDPASRTRINGKKKEVSNEFSKIKKK